MARLAGKFAGILMVEVEPAKHADLEQALSALSAHGIKIIVEQSAPSQEKDAKSAASKSSPMIAQVLSVKFQHCWRAIMSA